LKDGINAIQAGEARRDKLKMLSKFKGSYLPWYVSKEILDYNDIHNYEFEHTLPITIHNIPRVVDIEEF
jgi:hypothetical protein